MLFLLVGPGGFQPHYCARIVAERGFVLLRAGDLLREASAGQGEHAATIREHMEVSRATSNNQRAL